MSHKEKNSNNLSHSLEIYWDYMTEEKYSDKIMASFLFKMMNVCNLQSFPVARSTYLFE